MNASRGMVVGKSRRGKLIAAALLLGGGLFWPLETSLSASAGELETPPLNLTVMGWDNGKPFPGLPMTMMPYLRSLFDQIRAQGVDMTIDLGDGTTPVRVLDEKTGDKFLPGKLALALSYVLIDLKERNDPAYVEYLAAYKDITTKMMAKNNDGKYRYDNDSFGEYYYLLALNNLNAKSMMREAFDEAMLATLKERLNFYDMFKTTDGVKIEDYQLVLPQNYYGVAYAIAGLRQKLGWENKPAMAREDLLTRLIEHYRKDSSGGFSDEAPNGGGRFDRYSVLLIAEIVQRSIEMGNEAAITPEMKGYLRRSVDIILPQLNTDGQGFNYGRSIGPYGDTAFMEILTAAANMNLLSQEETYAAYVFISRVALRYANFWYDPDAKSLNMWVKGRGTDGYRNSRRTLGENFTMMHQFLYVNAHWNKLGFSGMFSSPIKLQQWLDATQPRVKLTWYNQPDDPKHPYNAALITVRDRKRVINLNLNQAPEYDSSTPYFPVPFSDKLIYGTTDQSYPLLVPQITVTGQGSFAPVSYYKNLKVQQKGDQVAVTYDMPVFRQIKNADGKEVKDSDNVIAVAVETRYEFNQLASKKLNDFSSGIVRHDILRPSTDIDVDDIEMVFGSFAQPAQIRPKVLPNVLGFTGAEVASFRADGYKSCQRKNLSNTPLAKTPIGALGVFFSCTTGPLKLKAGQKYTFEWTLNYNN